MLGSDFGKEKPPQRRFVVIGASASRLRFAVVYNRQIAYRKNKQNRGMPMKDSAAFITSLFMCAFSLCGCAAQQQKAFYEKRETLTNMQICYLMYGEAAKANPSFSYDVRREGARRGISPADCGAAIQAKAINTMTTGASAISASHQIEAARKQQTAQPSPTQPASRAPDQGYTTRDAYGNLVNSKSSYTTRDANGTLVNSGDSYSTRDNLGNIVNSRQPHQTLDSNGVIVTDK